MMPQKGSKERSKMIVSDIMRTPVITISENKTIFNLTKLMEKHNVGSIVIVNRKKNPVGIVTERDLVRRVVAKRKSVQVKCREIMSQPLVTILPDVDLGEAAARMGRYGIRRLLVMDGEKLVGIFSSTEIVRVTPSYLDIILEGTKINTAASPGLSLDERIPLTGHCESCGQWSDFLKEINGKFTCEECAAELSEEEEEMESED